MVYITLPHFEVSPQYARSSPRCSRRVVTRPGNYTWLASV